MKRAAAIAQIRLLCAQALPGAVVVPHVLNVLRRGIREYADTDDEAMLVTDQKGRMLQSCARTMPLLLAALHLQLAAGTPLRRGEDAWTNWLGQLCDRLLCFSRHESDSHPRAFVKRGAVFRPATMPVWADAAESARPLSRRPGRAVGPG